ARHLDDSRPALVGGRRCRRGDGGQEEQARYPERNPGHSFDAHSTPSLLVLSVGPGLRPGTSHAEEPRQRELLGSNASRSPSPSRLNASVVSSSAIPGQTISSGLDV